MVLLKKTFALKVEILDLPTPSFPSWFKEEHKKQFIEVLVVKINPKRLARGYSSIIIATANLPEWASIKK